MRDRLADSRFDIIRLCFRSSTSQTGRFWSLELEFELAGFWSDGFGSSELEIEPTGFGDWGMPGKSSQDSQGVEHFSKNPNGSPII
uniref:Uncharacterized protein n=1 Tax=Rhizophora mucronata TaxID=61149 RepID=A0A2P2NZS7_RHIMU